MIMALVFDCETYRIPNAADFLPPVSVPPVKADGRLKDAAKVEADLAAKEQERQKEIAEKTQAQLDECALNPFMARVVALGWSWQNEESVTVRIAPSEAAEVTMLDDFWHMVVDAKTGYVPPLIGFNSRAFDLPLLMVRSMLLGVKAPKLNIDRWRSPHPDIMRELSQHEAVRFPKGMGSLRWFAKRMGLPMDDAFSGAEVAQLVESGNWDAIKAHCEWDVRTCKAIAVKWGVLRPYQVLVA